MNGLDGLMIPEHVAIILDGNGRWAVAHNVPRAQGHKAGCEHLERIMEECVRIGIRYLTVYAFSTENWKRSEEEVGALMNLFRFYTPKLIDKARKNNVRIHMIGDKSRFPQDIQKDIDLMLEATSGCTGMVFTYAVNYGGRDEIRRAVQKIVEEGIHEISDSVIEQHLDTAGMPDPDLLIRTSGELRISNFLNWQIAYSEIYVTDTLWPDFDTEELYRAVAAYNTRNRRFGGR